jgi:hypothetical protein
MWRIRGGRTICDECARSNRRPSVRWRARPHMRFARAPATVFGHAQTRRDQRRSIPVPVRYVRSSKIAARYSNFCRLPGRLIVLHRFAWSSVPSALFPVGRVREMAASWRFNNERLHLSGILLSTGAHFAGLLEGHECDLDRLWLRLQKDDRHRKLMRTEDGACGTRWFPAWTLTCTDKTHLDEEIDALRSTRPSTAARGTQATHQIMLQALAGAKRCRE